MSKQPLPMTKGDILERIKEAVSAPVFDMLSGATWLQAVEAATGREFEKNELGPDPVVVRVERVVTDLTHQIGNMKRIIDLERRRKAYWIEHGTYPVIPNWSE
jgi:hypothetical protein